MIYFSIRPTLNKPIKKHLLSSNCMPPHWAVIYIKTKIIYLVVFGSVLLSLFCLCALSWDSEESREVAALSDDSFDEWGWTWTTLGEWECGWLLEWLCSTTGIDWTLTLVGLLIVLATTGTVAVIATATGPIPTVMWCCLDSPALLLSGITLLSLPWGRLLPRLKKKKIKQKNLE